MADEDTGLDVEELDELEIHIPRGVNPPKDEKERLKILLNEQARAKALQAKADAFKAEQEKHKNDANPEVTE